MIEIFTYGYIITYCIFFIIFSVLANVIESDISDVAQLEELESPAQVIQIFIHVLIFATGVTLPVWLFIYFAEYLGGN